MLAHVTSMMPFGSIPLNPSQSCTIEANDKIHNYVCLKNLFLSNSFLRHVILDKILWLM